MISVSKFLSHTPEDSKHKYIHTYGKSGYGKATTFSFSKQAKLEDLLDPANHAFAFATAIFDKANVPTKKGKNTWDSYVRREDNILSIDSISYDFDTSAQSIDEVKTVLEEAKARYVLISTQSSAIKGKENRFKLIMDLPFTFTQTGTEVDTLPLIKYKDFYMKLAHKLGVQADIDDATKDPARLLAPFKNPNYDYPNFKVLSNLDNDPIELDIEAMDLQDTVEAEVVSQALVTVADWDKLGMHPSKSITHLAEAECSIVKRDENGTPTYQVNNLNHGVTTDRGEVPLYQLSHAISKGVSLQVACGCSHLHSQDSNVGYGILKDEGEGRYSLRCNSANSPERHIEWTIAGDTIPSAPKHKYSKLTPLLFINRSTGKHHTLVTMDTIDIQLLEATSELVDADVGRLWASMVYYFPKENRFVFKAHVGANSYDDITEDKLLANLQIVSQRNILKPAKDGYDFHVANFLVALPTWIKAQATRIDHTEYRIGNQYEPKTVVEDGVLVTYKHFPTLVEPVKPQGWEESYEHFTTYSAPELDKLLQRVVASSFGQRSGLRFALFFATGGHGKGIIADSLYKIGAGLPISSKDVELMSGTDGEARVGFTPSLIAQSYLPYVSDVKNGKVLANSKFLTDMVNVRTLHGQYMTFQLNALWVFAADGIDIPKFFSGEDSGQLLRRYNIPEMGNRNHTLLAMPKPSTVAEGKWCENSIQVAEYIKGVTYGIYNSMQKLIASYKEDSNRELPFINEMIDREHTMKQASMSNANKIIRMVGDFLDFYDITAEGNHTKTNLDNSFVAKSLADFSFHTTSNKIVFPNVNFLKQYGEYLNSQSKAGEGFGFNTQTVYLEKYFDYVTSSNGSKSRTSAVNTDTSKPKNYVASLPIDLAVFAADFDETFMETELYKEYVAEKKIDSVEKLTQQIVTVLDHDKMPQQVKNKALGVLFKALRTVEVDTKPIKGEEEANITDWEASMYGGAL